MELRKANILNTQLVPMIGYENRFLVSPFGQIYSLKKRKLLSIHRKPNGYLFVQIYDKSKFKNKYIHRLVALHYIDNTLNKKCINHKDGLKCNNRIDNLEWSTHKENNDHAWDTGLNPNRFGNLTRKTIKKIKS